MDTHEIFGFLENSARNGQRAALVTLVAAQGSSMRAAGAHMAVAQDGTFVGSLSGGCIERAVVAEALDAIAAGQPRMTRFGQGSRYIDIRLPCGGGVDLHFQPLDGPGLARQALAAIADRMPFSLELTRGERAPRFVPHWQPTGWSTERELAIVGHWPGPRLLILGHGAALGKLAVQARTWGAEVTLATPDEELTASLVQNGFSASMLRSPRDSGAIVGDPWTAMIFLFHDHDWEPALIASALDQPHFFIGAMGSKRAHAARREALRRIGIPEAGIARISAPIGLFHSVRDPDTLALSVLAEVADRYRTHDFAAVAQAAKSPAIAETRIRQTG